MAAPAAPFGVYVHIPFCASKCDYCAFATWTDRGHLIDRYLDGVDVAKIIDFENALHDFAKANHGDLLDGINESGDYNDEVEAVLKSICDGFAEKGAY